MPPVMHLLADTNNIDLFNLMVSKANLEKKDLAGWSLLQICAEKGRNLMIEKLLELNVSVDYENEGMSALDMAVHNNQWNCVDLLRKSALRKEAKPKIETTELTE
jgi:ankyrin repeat protein